MSDPNPQWLLEQQADTLEAFALWLNYFGEDEVAARFWSATRALRGEDTQVPERVSS